nr:hypothetical protein [Ramlibacter sp.]
VVQALNWLARANAAPPPALLAALAAFSAPLMPQFAWDLAHSLGLADVPRWSELDAVNAVMPASLPVLSMEVQAA